MHLTDYGFNNLYRNMSQAMSKVLDRMLKDSKDGKISSAAPIFVSGGSYYWRGFSSPVGSVRRPTSSSQSTRGGGRGSRGRGFSGFGGSFAGDSRSRGGHGGTPYDRSSSKN